MIQIRQPQNDLAARRFPVPLAHMGGLLTVDMHKLEQLPSYRLDDKSALAMKRNLTIIAGDKRVEISAGSLATSSTTAPQSTPDLRHGSTALPGAFSITNFFARDAEETAMIRESGRKVAMDMLSMPGLISMVSTVVGDCLMTITAWETQDSMAPLMKQQGEHRAMVSRYFTSEVGYGGMTGVWVPGRLNPRRVRCPGCDKMTPDEAPQQKCRCGAVLPDPLACW